MSEEHNARTAREEDEDLDWLLLSGTVAAGVLIALYGAHVASRYVGDLWVWGGTSCTPMGDSMACVGILPAGLFVFLFAGVLLSGAAYRGLTNIV